LVINIAKKFSSFVLFKMSKKRVRKTNQHRPLNEYGIKAPRFSSVPVYWGAGMGRGGVGYRRCYG